MDCRGNLLFSGKSSQGFCFLVGGQDGLHGGGAESGGFQSPDACNGAAAGAAHGILQDFRVRLGVQRQPGAAQEHLGGIFPGFGPGQTAGNGAVGQGL